MLILLGADAVALPAALPAPCQKDPAKVDQYSEPNCLRHGRRTQKSLHQERKASIEAMVALCNGNNGYSWLCYAQNYPDLMAVFGRHTDALRTHFWKFGYSESRSCACKHSAPSSHATRPQSSSYPPTTQLSHSDHRLREDDRSQTLFKYQLPAIVACSLQPFLDKCKRDLARPPPLPSSPPRLPHTLLDCAMKHFLTQQDDALQRCVEHEEATNQAPDMLRLAMALAHSTGCRPWAGNVRKLPRVWMGVSVKEQPHDLARFILHHWCLGVHKFLIYDESTSSSVHQMAVRAQKMIPIHYEKSPPKSQISQQVAAIRMAARMGAQWVGGLDVDEYLHVPGADLPILLQSLPSHVGVASFKLEMFSAGQSYNILSDGQRGSQNAHVKSFAHVERVELLKTDPHHKILKKGYVQLLMGPNKVMPNGPFATRDGRCCGNKSTAGEIGILPEHPSCLHFHEKPTLADAVRKLYRGTGATVRERDTMPLNEMLWTLSDLFVLPLNRMVGSAAVAERKTSFNPAFAALVQAVGRYTSNLSR
mmetsp:Transcript_23925/g.39567  ORF Transcript_23925/g.39567 Transcript_23925/m.39567 type:complete len:535 (-) Transcript_23925:213-1817(-)